MDIAKLERQVDLSKWILLTVIAVTVSAYMLKFSDRRFGEPDAWGQFGDYLGGVMNPLIAFGAFYWLATSVMLQKRELSETKEALIASQKAQQQQADMALLAAKIQTINIRLASSSTALERLLSNRDRLAELQRVNSTHYMFQNEFGDYVRIDAALKDITEEISTEMLFQTSLMEILNHYSHELDPVSFNEMNELFRTRLAETKFYK